MRKVIVTEFVSLDGVMEAPDQWHFPWFNDQAGQYKLDEVLATDALLLGRVTYEGFAAAWPSATDDQGFADRFNSIPKYVVSTTLDKAEWNNSHIITENVAGEITRLKQEPGQDIAIHGSAALVNSLMPLGLIDEYRLMVHPVVVGRGKRLFQEGAAETPLKLVDTTTFDSGVIVLTYHPA